MPILYLVLYLLSKCSKFPQGTFSHSKQNFASPFLKNSQILILHCILVTGLFVSSPLQPGHLFFSRRYALQIPQFIPQGATRERSFNEDISLTNPSKSSKISDFWELENTMYFLKFKANKNL